jgi:hypothetical protein
MVPNKQVSLSIVQIEKALRVDERNNPELDWKDTPKGTWVISEIIQSDAFRSLSKIETDIFLFILTKRNFPRKNRNNWKPSNRDFLKIPGVAIGDFFDGKVRGMMKEAPCTESVRRAFSALMRVGFLSLVKIGGSGKGDQNIYRLEHNWRLWKEGDAPCFTKAGMTREKGFVVPGSGRFNRKRPTGSSE